MKGQPTLLAKPVTQAGAERPSYSTHRKAGLQICHAAHHEHFNPKPSRWGSGKIPKAS